MLHKIKNCLIILSIILFVILIICGIAVSVNQRNNKIKDETEKIYRVSNYNNPIVPNGFKKVETEKASWEVNEKGEINGWNNGLVIEDELGNQFVWVPVLDEHKDEEYLISNNEEEIQFFKYGGFYISRYEAGVPEELQAQLKAISNETNDVIGIPVSQKNTKPWNYISYNNANESAKLMYNTENVKSELMSLNKSKMIIKWLKESGYDTDNSSSWGNFSDVAYRFSGLYSSDTGKSYQYANDLLKDDNIIIGTGVTDRNMANNIYDLAGNLREYTNTQYKDTKFHYSIGGYYSTPGKGNSGHPASEQYVYADEPVGTTGFRVCLILFNK